MSRSAAIARLSSGVMSARNCYGRWRSRRFSSMSIYWLEQGQRDLPLSDDWLSADEAVRLDGMRFEKRRADWRLGRWTAKLAISVYYNAPCRPDCLRRFEIRPETSGAPNVWIGRRPAPLTISLSHSAGSAVCAV